MDHNIELDEFEKTDYKKMYVAALLLMTETGSEGTIDLAHVAVLTLLEKIDIDFATMESRKIH